jgi:hypothetical protein
VVIDNTFSTRLGGPTAAERNVISGNTTNGVNLIDAVGTLIQGNYIGTNAAGTADLGNTVYGVSLDGESRQNRIGDAGAGNVISGNNNSGIFINEESNDNVVLGNLIGTNAAGTAALGNGSLNEFLDLVGSGILLIGFNNQVGEPGAGNVISGNGTGISLAGITAANNVVRSNLVGTNAAGDAAIRNRFGIFNGSAPGTVIGGPDPLERNIVSGNQLQGIYVTGEGASGVVIQGNRIGTTADGMSALSNTFAGITVESSAIVTIGGDLAAAGNLISGNNGAGIRIQAGGSVIRNNKIGVDATFTGPLANGSAGISIAANNTTIDANVIAFNTSTGISFTGSSNAILANAIFDNGGLGIDAGLDGVTANDDESDGIQNFPVLSSAVLIGGTTTISGTLVSTPGTTFEIRFYTNAACDASGFGEGATQVLSGNFPTNVDGTAVINVVVPGLSEGQVITARARNLTTGDSSEFSGCVTVRSPAPEPEAAPIGAGLTEWSGLLLEPPAGVRDEPLLVALRLE